MSESGGSVFYLVDLYRRRARVRVRILAEHYHKRPPRVRFEAENVGLTPTSIVPSVRLVGFLPRPKGGRSDGFKLRRFELTFSVKETQRALAPHKPEEFEAIGADPAALMELGFSWFKIYTFSFTRGRKCRVRVRSADKVVLSLCRYAWERLNFKFRGKVVALTTRSLE